MRRALVLLVVALVALSAPVARADRVSRSEEAFVNDQSQLCRSALGTSTADCNRDGYDLSDDNVGRYEASELHQLIAVQRTLDEHAPLKDALFPHTHNSFNSEAYRPTLSRLDNNQLLSLKDQLRLDIRAIEIDIHRTVSVHDGRIGVVACHAQDAADTLVHPGCTTEESLDFYLDELREWLIGNPTELVLLYLENKLDGDEAAHDEAAAIIKKHLDGFVHRPPVDAPCAEMPYDMSRAQLRPAQVLIVGNCDAGHTDWGSWVHERGGRWEESGNSESDVYSCAAERDPTSRLDYDSEITRRYEDRTWLTVMVDDGILDAEGGQITAREMADMVACGVNLVGFDLLHPDDPRLASLVWSWAGIPAAGTCPLQQRDGRWRGSNCGEHHPAACFSGGVWHVSPRVVTYADAAKACAFAAPRNGWENQLLLAARKKHVDGVWVSPSDTQRAP